MSAASIARIGRRHEEGRMLDQFDICYPTGPLVADESGTEQRSLEVDFSTKGRVKSGGLVVRSEEVGGRTASVVTRELRIPVDSSVVRSGAIAVCTYADKDSDPTLLGARLTLSGPAPGSQTTARRLQVQEVVS